MRYEATEAAGLPSRPNETSVDGEWQRFTPLEETDMTVTNSVGSSSSQSRRARLAAAANPVLAGPSTSAVAVGTTVAGDVPSLTLPNAPLRLHVAPLLRGRITPFAWRTAPRLEPSFSRRP